MVFSLKIGYNYKIGLLVPYLIICNPLYNVNFTRYLERGSNIEGAARVSTFELLSSNGTDSARVLAALSSSEVNSALNGSARSPTPIQAADGLRSTAPKRDLASPSVSASPGRAAPGAVSCLQCSLARISNPRAGSWARPSTGFQDREWKIGSCGKRIRCTSSFEAQRSWCSQVVRQTIDAPWMDDWRAWSSLPRMVWLTLRLIDRICEGDIYSITVDTIISRSSVTPQLAKQNY